MCILYDRTGWWNHLVIASVKVFWLFLIVDIISNCQTIIIDNYTKNRGNFFEWNEYNFDDIDKLMLKRKADDEFHSSNTTVWALRSVQCHGKAISTRLKFVKKLACSYESMFVMITKKRFQTIIKLCFYSKMLDKHNSLLNYFSAKKTHTSLGIST